MDVTDNSRLALARSLRELADGSSEAALRSALSRSYYSIYHAAKVLDRKIDHDNLVSELEKIEKGLGERAAVVKDLRAKPDYNPGLVNLEYGDNIELFKREARHQVNEGLKVFERIVREIEERSRLGSQ
jgi:uncharacterized protein (UPF0332 family)